jgi:hypothetical protein
MTAAILELTRTALADLKSPTDLYRLQVNIQQFATPDEIAALMAEQSRFPKEFNMWLGGMLDWMTGVRKDIPTYQRRMIGDHITLYSAPTQSKALAIGFSGKAGRLFMPTPLVLQYFSVGSCDLLIIRDPERIGFVNGVPGYAASVEDLPEKLGSDVDFDKYPEIRTLGTSGGSVAALILGARLNAPHAVSFSGHLPSVSPRYGTYPGSAALEAALRSLGPRPDYVCVFGATNGFDLARALEINKLVPLRLMPIKGVSDHNVMFALHQRGELTKLLREVGLI